MCAPRMSLYREKVKGLLVLDMIPKFFGRQLARKIINQYLVTQNNSGASLRFFLIIISVMLPGCIAQAFDYELMTFGAESKSHSGATVMPTLGAPAALYNPANLSLAKRIEPYIESSGLLLKYKFKHPDFSATKLDLNLPIVSFGIDGKASRKLSYGVFTLVAPADVQHVSVKKLPTRQLSEDPALVDLSIGGGKSTSYLIGTGLSYKLGRVSLGISLVTSKIYGDTKLVDHETGTNVMDIDHNVGQMFGIVGFRWEALHWLALGGTYQAAYSPKFYVKSNNEGGTSSTFSGKKGQQIKVGLCVQKREYRLNTEIHYKQHSKTSGDVFSFLSPDASTQNHDTISYVTGFDRRSPLLTLGFSYGRFQTYVSDGVMASRSEIGNEVRGNSFGNLDGISRQVHSLYGQFNSKLGLHVLGLSYTKGTRSMPEDSRGYGVYSLEVFSINLGSRFTF